GKALPFERLVPRLEDNVGSLALSETVTRRLDAIADQFSVSVSTLLLACWQTVLLRSTSWEESHVGVAFDGRNFPELREAIGPIERYLPISAVQDEETTFSKLLKTLSDELAESARLQQFFASDEKESWFFPVGFAWYQQP